MSQQKAAEYFIVAWVKGWTLNTYLQVVGAGTRIERDDAHALYGWLPPRWPRGSLGCRVYLAEVNKPLSDALWDAADDRARLALAPRLAAFVFTQRHRGYATEALRGVAKTNRMVNTVRFLRQEMAIAGQIHRGSHWKVCK